MIPVLSRAQMRAFDTHVIEACRVPGLVLMENAGRGAADVLVREGFGGDARGASVVVVCGIGNNGGDGWVVARHLLGHGARVSAFLAGESGGVSGDARVNLDAYRGLGGEVHELDPSAVLAPLAAAMGPTDIVVDALFGTGLSRPIDGFLADVVRTMNAAPARRFAIDLPSGLDADTGVELGVAVRAQWTVTFAHRKLGLLTPRGALHAGRVHVVDIGVPGSLVERIGHSAELLEARDVMGWMRPRVPGEYKTSAGHVVVIAGSPGRVGAPQLVARGAMRAGGGLATIATWSEVASAIESHVLEAMTARIDASQPGKSLDAILTGKDAVVVGPGLGLGDAGRGVVEHVLCSWKGPLIADADALTMCAGRPEAFQPAKSAILTPHPGEAARLLGRSAAQVEGDRYGAARDLASRAGAVIVLKGAHTIVASPTGRVAVSPVACPALATAGAGDVLGGIIGAMACSLAPFEAACAGVLLHAMAGQAWSLAHGGADRGLLASEIADYLPMSLSQGLPKVDQTSVDAGTHPLDGQTQVPRH